MTRPSTHPAHGPRRAPRRRRQLHRRGVTAVMAMLYLVLFSTLAVGFYAAVSASVQISGNEQRADRARLAAESGMEFMKLQLGTLGVPAGTEQADLWDAVVARLHAKLDDSDSMPAASRTVAVSADGSTVLIPGDPDAYIALDNLGSKFRASVRKKGTGDQLEVTVWGAFGTTTASARGLRLEYDNAPNEAKIFDYGVATPGKIEMNGNVSIRGTAGNAGMGSVLSAWNDPMDPIPLIMSGTSEISGKALFVNPDASPYVSSTASINDASPGDPEFADAWEAGVEEPEFPVIDTSAFQQYAPTEYDSSMGGTLTNVYLPPGDYEFNNATINGVLYVMQPSTVKFSGGTTINGVIVADNEKHGSHTSNTISFRHVNVGPYPESSPQGLKDLGGSFLLADNFSVDFGGNFNTVAGSVVASQISFSGTAGGTIKGNIISLSDGTVSLAGTSDIVIESQGANNRPSGLFFGSHYEPLPETFEEVRP